MKKFKRMLAGLACVLAVCLCTPTAFAAKVIVYFDANGGTCTSAAERTNDEGKLGSLPGASMEGYTFDGWYTTGTDDVTGFPIDVQVKANDTAFGADTTVYAHWSANGGSAEVVEEKEVDPDTLLTTMGLAAGSVVLVLLASLALCMEYRQGQRMPLTRSGCLAERWYPIWSLITKQWQTGSLRWIL